MRLARLILLCSFLHGIAMAQNYSGLNGSSYTGSLSVHNNPGAIVNAPTKWDVTLFGIQDKHTTNAVRVYKYSFLSNPANSEYELAPGEFKRYGDVNVNLNLLNTRIALNKTNAIAFGVNVKSYLTLRTGRYNFYDTLSRFSDFFKLNEGNTDLNVKATTSSYLEFYASYAKTLMDNDVARLNGGITLKINRGISGAFLRLAKGSFGVNTATTPRTYFVTGADLDLGYSWNYDSIDSLKNGGQNFRNFVTQTEGGGSVDIGFEYLVKIPGATSQAEEEEGYYDYSWKFGASILDLGYSKYHYGQYSITAKNVINGITDELLDQKFDSTINNMRDVRDTIFSLYQNRNTPPGLFKINHPTRLVLNVDRFITGAFFINADLSIPLRLGSTLNEPIKDISLLTVTPRWETRKLGFYLPISFNNQQQTWIGGAARVGPLLLGVHNWANLFSKNKINSGGAYLALIIRPGSVTNSKGDKRLDCFEF